MQKEITVRQCRIQDLQRPDNNEAFVITNPPYGERLSKEGEVQKLYKETGDVLKQRFAGSVAWIISSNEDALKCIGLKPSKRIPLLNGELDCHFNCYELFSGAHKEFKRDIAEGKRERRPESDYKHHKYASHKRPERSKTDEGRGKTDEGRGTREGRKDGAKRYNKGRSTKFEGRKNEGRKGRTK